jgi:transcriptional regulator with XRE-family HTH domain
MLISKITGVQLKAARTLANLTRDDLALRAGLSRDCIRLWESSSDSLPSAHLRPFVRLVEALEAAGIEFRTDGSIFRERATPIRTVIHSESVTAS